MIIHLFYKIQRSRDDHYCTGHTTAVPNVQSIDMRELEWFFIEDD